MTDELPQVPRNLFASLSFRDWVFIPHLLSRRERAIFGLFLAVALVSGSMLGVKALNRLTIPAPARGGEYVEGVMRAPERLNPLFLSTNDTDRDIVNLLFAKLFRYGPSGEFIPDLARSYAVSEDGKSYTVELRDNARWHDNARLDADDVMFTIKAIQDPAYKSSLRANWQGVTIERLGDFSVRFVLKQPYSPFLQNLAIPILPRHIWEKIPAEAASLAEANIKPVGSGPYRFSALSRDKNGIISQYKLEANERYHLAGPYIKSIEFEVFPSEESLIQAFKAGLIDGFSVLSARNVELMKSVGANVSTVRMPRIFAIFMNEANPVLKDRAMRQALAMAIPKETLIKDVLGGGAIAIDSPIPPGTFGHYPDIPVVAYDPEKAKTILAKAGWTDTDNDGIREKKATKKGGEPTRLSLTLATSEWKDLAASAAEIKKYWEAIGVATELRILPISELESEVIRPRKYDALLFGEILGRDPDPFAFWHSSQLKDPGLNIALYHSPRTDQLLEQSRRATDPEQIRTNYEQFQKAVAEDFPAIFLFSPSFFYAHRAYVHGIDLSTVVLPSERFDNVNMWFIETRPVFR